MSDQSVAWGRASGGGPDQAFGGDPAVFRTALGIGMNDLEVEAILFPGEFGAEINAAHAGLAGERQHAAAGHQRPDLGLLRRRKRRPRHQARRNSQSTSDNRPPRDPVSLGHLDVLLLKV